MAKEHYTMAELMEEFDRQEKERLEREEKERLEAIERRRLERIAEKERKHAEYLAEKERRHQEYLAEKERKRAEYLAEKERIYKSDEAITCKKCGKEFIWTAGEKVFYRERGFHRPSLCKECKANQKMRITFHK